MLLLSLDGKAHDLQVGYVAESPVWRPSYRLVVHAEGDADLQVWGIVENLSGEDWTNVKLSLIAGAPLAFRAELGTPVIPPRPTVTDEGEVIAAVPRAETSLQPGACAGGPGARLRSPSPGSRGRGSRRERRGERRERGERGRIGHAAPKAASADKKADKRRMVAHGAARSMAPPAAMRAAVPMPSPVMEPSSAAISAPRNLTSLAAVAVEGGSTRYDLPLPVTIPDKSATMVMLLSRTVSGEALFLFAPDGGVPDSSSHPFRVARFTNGAGGTLERGPIAVIEGGAILGQGMVDPLPAGATATVPFALERGIAIDEDRKYDELGARLAKIENGQLTVERDRVTQTKYRVRNGAELPAKLLVKHPRTSAARASINPPPGTEEQRGDRLGPRSRLDRQRTRRPISLSTSGRPSGNRPTGSVRSRTQRSRRTSPTPSRIAPSRRSCRPRGSPRHRSWPRAPSARSWRKSRARCRRRPKRRAGTSARSRRTRPPRPCARS